MSGDVVVSSEAELLEHPERILERMRAGITINFPSLGYTTAPIDRLPYVGTPSEDDLDEAGDMTSLRKNRTGVENTVFVSTRRDGRHAARIKIAIDPPHNLNPAGDHASMAIHDFGIRGAHMPRWLADQAQQFIEANREALLEYWDETISTDEMIARLKPIS
jgi:hypothetical protein